MGEFTGRLHYGADAIEGFLPKSIEDQGRLVPINLPQAPPEIADVEEALDRAISHSRGTDKLPSLETIFTKHYHGGLVSIIVDDHTRPNVHTRMLLPILLGKLRSFGIPQEKTRLIIAHGTHRAAKREEYVHIFGEPVWSSYMGRVEDHDCAKGVELIGTLEDGLPVEFNRTAYASEVIISLSDLDYHYFAGMGGGPKQIVPGIAGKNTITQEHLKMFGKIGFAKHVEMGVTEHNPVFECKVRLIKFIEQALRAKGAWMYGIVTVVNARSKLVHIAGGDILDIHKQGKSILASVSTASIPREADIVIVAARHLGIDLYQACKAFNSGRHAVKAGGKIVVLAPCTDGWGSEEFKGLMAVGAPILRETAEKVKDLEPKERMSIADIGIEKALMAVQEVVMRDFKIGKQKPVDLLVTQRHCGWGNTLMVQEGLTDKDEAMLPVTFIGKRGDSPAKRLKEWIVKVEEETGGKLSYLLLDNPNLLLSARH